MTDLTDKRDTRSLRSLPGFGKRINGLRDLIHLRDLFAPTLGRGLGSNNLSVERGLSSLSPLVFGFKGLSLRSLKVSLGLSLEIKDGAKRVSDLREACS